MSIDEMRWKITSSLNNLSEKKLEEVLNMIKEDKKAPALRYDINSQLDQVLREDAELLKRLAE